VMELADISPATAVKIVRKRVRKVLSMMDIV
jgi:hypothetical protein